MRYSAVNGGLSYRIIDLDLTTGENRSVGLTDGSHHAFLGGAGLAAHLIFDELTPQLDPLGSEAPIVIATGPLTGTTGPAVGRFVICAKSPATNAWGESNIGGRFGAVLRSAGIDALVLRGRLKTPGYLWIKDGEIAVKSAGHLWGVADAYETQRLIRDELEQKNVSVICIGLAGEVLIPFAVVLGDHGRVAGRTGMGAVMGSKNLKAIAVAGSLPIPIADPDRFSQLRASINRELRDDLVSKGLRDFGTSSASDVFDYFGLMPKHYFTKGQLEGTDSISGMTVAETIQSGVSTCHGCVIACGRRVSIRGKADQKGPEYETKVGFGPNLGITDVEVLTALGDLCDRYGMDTISLSSTIGLAFALYEEGVIGEAETKGYPLRWGDTEVVVRLIHETAQRIGFGEQLAGGALHLAERYGVPERALHVRGLELGYHDPRGASGMALVYATSPRGACHNQGPYYLVEIGQTREELGIEMRARQAGPGKALNVIRHQDWTSLLNSLVMCIFANVPTKDLCELVSAGMGKEFTSDDLMQIGERAFTLKRMINVNLGQGVDADTYPAPLRKALAEGGASRYVPPFEEMLSEYYSTRNWSPDTGLPGADALRSLGLASYNLNVIQPPKSPKGA